MSDQFVIEHKRWVLLITAGYRRVPPGTAGDQKVTAGD